VPAAERREQLLKAAREIILRDGVGALNMSALADAVGVTKPIVYKHFQNSEDVIIHILKRYAQGSIDTAAAHVRGAKTIYEFMDGIVESLFEHIKAEGAVARSITNGFSSSERVDAWFLAMQDRFLRVFRHLLQQQGVTEAQSLVGAYALMEMINSTVLEFATKSDHHEKETLKMMVRGALRVLVRGRGAMPKVPRHLLVETATE
jgi:AcrR family transcriptional regulator